MTSTEKERPKREDFEQWSISANQGYDLTRNQSGRMQTYEHVKTEHAWRGFYYGWQAARRAPVVPQDAVESVTKAIMFEDCGSIEGWKDNISLGLAAIKAYSAMDAEHWAELYLLREDVKRSDGVLWKDVAAQERARRATVVPEGWRLIPEWPTVQMSVAGDDVYREGGPDVFSSNTIYTRMLAAAPQPPEEVNLVRSMAMLLRQLTSILRSKDPESSAVKRAMVFMTKHGLNGSPLRADVPENASTDAACTGVGTLCTSDEPKSVPEATPVELPESLLTLETDAHFIFNNPPGECPQAVRDVIEWYAGSVRALLASRQLSAQESAAPSK